MIKNIFLDLDDTIYDFKIAEEKALTKTLIDLGIEPKDTTLKRYSVLNESQWKLLELGKITRDQVKVRRFQLLFDEINANVSAIDAAKIYEGYLSMGHYFVEGAEDLLIWLHERYRLYLVSNGTASVQRQRLASSGIVKYFEEVFISQDIGFNKPSKEYFDYCFSKIDDFKKEESIIIGDSLSSDIKGGMNAGIQTIWFNLRNNEPNKEIVPDYTIYKLNELYEILK